MNGLWRASECVHHILHSCFAALFVILALAGCAQVATGQGQAPYAPYSQANNGEYPRDRGGDGGAGGGGM
jgi:hypothetical protein